MVGFPEKNCQAKDQELIILRYRYSDEISFVHEERERGREQVHISGGSEEEAINRNRKKIIVQADIY